MFSTTIPRRAAVAIVLVLALAGAVAPAAAQDAGDAAADAAENATNATNASVPEAGSQEPVERIDSDVVLTSYEYRGGEMRLHFRHSGYRPKTITIVESIQRAEGAGQMSIVQERLLPGDSTISVPVQRRAGEAAVAITTPESIEQRRAVFVSTGVNRPWFQGSASWELVYIGVGAAFLSTFWGTRKYLQNREDRENERLVEVVR